MALHCSLLLRCSTFVPTQETTHFQLPSFCTANKRSFRSSSRHGPLLATYHRTVLNSHRNLQTSNEHMTRASKAMELVFGNGREDPDSEDDDDEDDDESSSVMTDEERAELRRKIREVINNNPEVEEETDPEKRRIKMQKLLADYPLIVEDEDPNWPEDADGRGFKLDQFFDKITIKNTKKDDDEGDDYDSDKEIVWQDDNYIRPIRDISSSDWEETVFKDFNPLVILVHNRYKRPADNERARNELEKAVKMFWDSGLPSPRCVAVDAVVEEEIVSALQVSTYPQILFTKAAKILHRDKVVRTAEDWSKIMAFFYYKAVRPSCMDQSAGQYQEKIPFL